jgi:predicted ATPase
VDPRTVIDVDRFVGRAGELAALSGLVTAASAGEPAFGLVSGPAGIGKSRLLAAFAQKRPVAAGRSCG